jgi:hypothetical protein
MESQRRADGAPSPLQAESVHTVCINLIACRIRWQPEPEPELSTQERSHHCNGEEFRLRMKAKEPLNKSVSKRLFPSGAKARLILLGLMYGLNRLRKKAQDCKNSQGHPSGAKAQS